MRSKFQFCALVFAVSLCGCANYKGVTAPPPPGTDPKITLEIQQSSTVTTGYLATYGSKGTMYIYRFSGGNRKHGHLEFPTGGGAANIHIKLDASSNFAIEEILIDNDPSGQLTRHIASDGAKIHNDNTRTLDAYYSVRVLDNTSAEGEKIYFDPKIVNN